MKTDFECFLQEIGLTQSQLDAVRDRVAFRPITTEDEDVLRILPSPIHGVGVHAITGFRMNEPIRPIMMNGVWTAIGRFMNHSATPNCSPSFSGSTLSAVAIREINPGDEITINYRDVGFAVGL